MTKTMNERFDERFEIGFETGGNRKGYFCCGSEDCELGCDNVTRKDVLAFIQSEIDLAVAEERKRIENNIERYGFYDKYRNMNLEIAQNQSTINLITDK